MQSALRSATRRAVGISSRRGVATTTTKAATAREPERDWLAESEKAWVAALVQREVCAQMLAEEERRIMRERDHLRATVVEEWPARRRLLILLWADYSLAALEGWVVGAGLAILLFGH